MRVQENYWVLLLICHIRIDWSGVFRRKAAHNSLRLASLPISKEQKGSGKNIPDSQKIHLLPRNGTIVLVRTHNQCQKATLRHPEDHRISVSGITKSGEVGKAFTMKGDTTRETSYSDFRRVSGGLSKGSQTRKVEPRSSVLSTSTVPPNNSSNRRTIYNPNPTPP